MASSKKDRKAKKGQVFVDIQFQIKVADAEGAHSKTFEYSLEAEMDEKKAHPKDAAKRELNLLKFLVSEFKDHAKRQKKQIERQQKAAKKGK